MDTKRKPCSIKPSFRDDWYWSGWAYQQMESTRIFQNIMRLINTKTRQGIDGRQPGLALSNELDQNSNNKSMKSIRHLNTRTVVTWFNRHDRTIPQKGAEAVAFLSCLFPESRPDRVFNIQENRLETIIQQAQCLGASRLKDLQRTIDGSDLTSCVERVIAATYSESRPGPSVTLEELEILDQIAATSSFSSIELRYRVQAKYTYGPDMPATQ
jgi:DNA ligase N terminus